MKRKLLFGATLILAFASMFAGLFGLPRLQIGLVLGALILAGLAIRAPREEG